MIGAGLRIEVRDPDETTRWVDFEGDGPAWIGRDDGCAVKLASPTISRRHVSLECTPDGLKVSDASANGTVVDELELVRSTRILGGSACRLVVGPYRIRAERRDVAPAAPAPVAQEVDRRAIHRKLLEHLDLASLKRDAMDAMEMRPRVLAALRRIIADGKSAPSAATGENLVRELCDEALGLGPLEGLLADADVSEIMVVDPHTIFAERRGRLELTGLRFTDDDSVRAVIERIVTPLGRRIDESTPLVDARLPDGSRVNAVIPPLAVRGPCITIRKFAKDPLGLTDLVGFGSLSDRMARFLERAVVARKNIVISGGTGSGKTTLLNALSGAIPTDERVVTVEDAAELQLRQPHVVPLEARPANLEGKGEYSIRDLVKNALRMRPDRIVVGECRGGEAIDMLQAMNTGHEGSMTTTHANSPREAVARIETLCLMAGLDLPSKAIRQQIASSIHVIVQQTRFSSGARRVTAIAEVTGLSDAGEIELTHIFDFRRKRSDGGAKLEGEFVATGYLPSFLEEFFVKGLVQEGDECL